MTKEMKQWVESTKAWIKTQELSIKSCEINIKHAKEQMALLSKTIFLEMAERELKIRALKTVKANLKKQR